MLQTLAPMRFYVTYESEYPSTARTDIPNKAGSNDSSRCYGSHNQDIRVHRRIETTTSLSTFPAEDSGVSRPGL
jgi:hypothetical protein